MNATQHGTGAHVVITMPNVFGISAALFNLSITYAMAGYRSYAMDIVYGDPMPRDAPRWWWMRHLYNNTVAHMQKVVDEIRADASVETIQAIGFCYGGGVALGMLAMERPVYAAVSAHPTWWSAEWWNQDWWTLGNLTERINSSASVMLVVPSRDEFNLFSADWITATARRNLDAAFTIYPGTSHGQAEASITRAHSGFWCRLQRSSSCAVCVVCAVVCACRLCIRLAACSRAAGRYEGEVRARHAVLVQPAQQPTLSRTDTWRAWAARGGGEEGEGIKSVGSTCVLCHTRSSLIVSTRFGCPTTSAVRDEPAGEAQQVAPPFTTPMLHLSTHSTHDLPIPCPHLPLPLTPAPPASPLLHPLLPLKSSAHMCRL